MDKLGVWGPKERAAYFRLKAKEASDMAASSSAPTTQQEYLTLAAKWTELANSTEILGEPS